jgi:hypothetical protein
MISLILLLACTSLCLAVPCNNVPSDTIPPVWTPCAGEPFTNADFVADPELRTYDGVEVVTFTGVIAPFVPHLYGAVRFAGNACFSKITQLTFDESIGTTEVIVSECRCV